MKHEHATVVLDFSANGIGIIRDLARRGIDVYAFDTEGPYRIGKSRLADCGICPSPLTQEEELLTFLTDFGKRFQAKPVLYAGSDDYAGFISKFRETLAGFFVFAPEPLSVRNGLR